MREISLHVRLLKKFFQIIKIALVIAHETD